MYNLYCAIQYYLKKRFANNDKFNAFFSGNVNNFAIINVY